MDIEEAHRRAREYWDGRATPWSTSSAGHSYLTEFFEAWKGRLQYPLLDIGCAEGKFLHRIASQGVLDIYGFDISPKLIEIAREKLRPLLNEETDKRIITLDMLDLAAQFPEGFFRSLIFSGVLQQTLYSAARQTMYEIAGVSSIGAIMYFSTRSLSAPPKDGTPVQGEPGTFLLPEGAVKTYFTRDGIERAIDGLFDIVDLEERSQTEKVSGTPIMNWEGVLRRS